MNLLCLTTHINNPKIKLKNTLKVRIFFFKTLNCKNEITSNNHDSVWLLRKLKKKTKKKKNYVFK